MKQLGWIIAIVIILGGGYWWWQGSGASLTSDDGTPIATDVVEDAGTQQAPAPVVDNTADATAAPMSATITYSANGFSPQEVTIKKGGTVTWKNATGGKMWVASAQHPSHTAYSGTTRQEHCPDAAGTAFDQCVGGGDYTFTFQKVGTWGYHDHLKASFYGKVTVVE